MINFGSCFPVFSGLSVFTPEKLSSPRYYWFYKGAFRLSGFSARKDPLEPPEFGSFRLSTLSAYYISNKPPERAAATYEQAIIFFGNKVKQ